MEKALSSGQTAPNTSEISKIINSTAGEFMSGRTDENMMVNGRKEKCMEKGSTLGRMEGHLRVNITWIQKKDLGFINGLTEGNTKEIGSTASNTAKAPIQTLKERVERVNG